MNEPSFANAPSNDLEGKTIIITGASRGIGRATAQMCIASGANVVGNYRSDDESAESLARSVGDRADHLVLLRGSVTDHDVIIALVNQAREKFGQIDGLVNNAGVTSDIYLSMMRDEQWDEVMDVNARATFRLCRRVLKPMAAKRRGSIVNLSSTSATRGRAGQVNYAASKGAVLALTKSLAHEVGRYDIRVNALVVGLIETDMTKQIPRRILDDVVAHTALGRLGRAEEVANLICFLLSDRSSFMTGSCVDITGGL